MANCATKMYARLAQATTTPPALAAIYNQHVQYMCARANSDGFCAYTTQDFLSGFSAAYQPPVRHILTICTFTDY